ncbi:MAG: Smr/MutS family protein [Patescibacteria group bacterium]|jgi:DNA-nicking Smr family endonuclease
MPKPWKTRQPSREEAAPLEQEKAVDPVEIALLAAEVSSDVPFLDLHGVRAEDARRELQTFLQHECAIGTSAVRIVHGKGTGVLEKVVLQFLAEAKREGIVKDYRSPIDNRRKGSVVVVALEV